MRPDASSVLTDEMAKRSLRRYFAVMQNEKPAKFLIAKKTSAIFSKEDSTEKLREEHTKCIGDFYRIEKHIDEGKVRLQDVQMPQMSFLDLKIEISRRILRSCHLCTRRCGVNRLEGSVGYCKCGSEIAVSSIFEHMGEEPELVPSGTIFTMGCTMRCKHCQNYTISQWMENGETYKPENLAKEVERLRANGCRNANLVGGEPTPWLGQWLETFRYVNVNMPVVWNSNFYYSPETAQLLAGFVDVYLSDFKYGKGKCAEKISDATDYWVVCARNHLEANRVGELIIRVLVLPNHLECCTKPVLNWIATNLGTGTRVNIMFQFRPEWRAHEVPELCRRLSEDEMKRAIQLAGEAKLENLIT